MKILPYMIGSSCALLLISSAYAGDAPNTIWLTNRGSERIVLDEMDVTNNAAPHKVNSITLDPGQSGAMGFWQGQAAYIAAEDGTGNIPATASRLEFYSVNQWANSIDISYIDGRNASIAVDDGMGKKIGSLQSLVPYAPPAALVYDNQGRAGIIGWHDGNNIRGRIGAAYIQSNIPCGSAFVHPDDNKNASCNPMRLGYDQSHNFYVDFSNP